MAQITAADVSKLRKMTGAGMMDCKIALQEADGVIDKAIDIIRKKGQALANKRADRDATEGAVLAGLNSKATLGAVIALNCETDFVAKNNDFVKLAQSILDVAVSEKPSDLSSLLSLSLNGRAISEIIIEQIGVIGEKIELAYYEKIEAGQVFSYIHPGNKLACIVGFNKATDIQVGKDIAMQIAAMSPIAVDSGDVSEVVIAKEKEIGREQALKEGKPEQMVDKIADGKVAKFLKENTLLNQDFTKDSKLTVKQYLKSIDADLTVSDFRRFGLTN